MPRSTASFIAYDVRPSKQIERRAMVECLGAARTAGYEIPSYRYVGFGGTKFVDFLLMQRFIGFSSYVSIEHDPDLFKRSSFNKPFHGIKMYSGAASTFLLGDDDPPPTVYWLDFEVALSPDLWADTKSIAGHLNDGDMCFITFKAEPPSGTKKKTDVERKKIIRDRFPGLRAYIEKMRPIDFSDDRFRHTAAKLFIKMVESAFSPRVDSKFQPIIKMMYQDSSWMCTLGGVFAKKRSKKAAKLSRLCVKHLGAVCDLKKYDYFEIPTFNFTELERILLDKSSHEDKAGYFRRLTSLGLEPEELEAYHAVSRLVPRYIESAF